MDNMVAKCKFVIVFVFVKLRDLISSDLKECDSFFSLQMLQLWLVFIQ